MRVANRVFLTQIRLFCRLSCNASLRSLKLEAFGFDTEEVDGHSFEALIPALEKRVEKKPRCIIANTIKGKGVSYMENKAEWHGGMPKGDQIEIAYKELGGEV